MLGSSDRGNSCSSEIILVTIEFVCLMNSELLLSSVHKGGDGSYS